MSELPEREGSAWVLAGLLLGASVALGGACVWVAGPLPGDVALTRGLQALTGASPAWAPVVTSTAKLPLVFGTAAVAAGLAFLRGGRSAALLALVAVVAAFGADALLRSFVFAPRPTPALVAVARASASSGLPSTFVLVYGTLFGAVVLGPGRAGPAARAALIAGIALMAIGASARIVLGGHWPSQVVASYCLAFAIVTALRLVMARWLGAEQTIG